MVALDRGAGSFGPFAEICKREWASCQQKQTAAAAATANSSVGCCWKPTAMAVREMRRAVGSRRLHDERCRRWTWAKTLDWWCHSNWIRQGSINPSWAASLTVELDWATENSNRIQHSRRWSRFAAELVVNPS